MNSELDTILESIKQNIAANKEKGYADLIYLIYESMADEDSLNYCLSFISDLMRTGIIKEKFEVTDFIKNIYCRNILNFLEELEEDNKC